MVVGALALLMPACTLDKFPTDRIRLEEAFRTFEDATRYHNGLYNELRRNRYCIFTTTSELMSDLFNARHGFGNRGGAVHRVGIELSGSAEARDIWGNLYGSIAQVNFFLDGIAYVEGLTAVQDSLVRNMIADAHYIRAFLYSELAAHFIYPLQNQTTTWNGHSVNTPELGLPLVDRYDVSARPGRATIAETFEFILRDLEAATAVTRLYGGPTQRRITLDAVHALKARVLFMMRDNVGAAHYANLLINSERFPLVTTIPALRTMFHNDNSPEDIFMLDATTTSFGRRAIYNPTVAWTEVNMSIFTAFNTGLQAYTADFIPTQTVLDLYEATDIRYTVFFSDTAVHRIDFAGRTPAIRMMYKFPGNPALGGMFRHRQRMHRIAEMYLIVAEAEQSVTRLNQLRVARGASFLPTWDEQAMRDEWVREFIGEGFRIQSLRRWGIGFDGRVPQDRDAVHGYGDIAFTARHVTPAEISRFFTLPIPTNDLQTNPNMRQTPSWR